MTKYHITAKGNPGICKAEKSCPLGSDSDHYPSQENARRAYELKQQLERIPTVASVSKKAKVEEDRVAELPKKFAKLKKETYPTLAKVDESYTADRSKYFAEANTKELAALKKLPLVQKLDWLKSKEKSLTAAEGIIRSSAFDRANGKELVISHEKAVHNYEEALVDYTEAEIALDSYDTRYKFDPARGKELRETAHRHLDNYKALAAAQQDSQMVDKVAQTLGVSKGQVNRTLSIAQDWVLGKRNSPKNLTTLAKNPMSIGTEAVRGSQELTTADVKEILAWASNYSHTL